MVTKEQALTERFFHYTGQHECHKHVGPRGGVKLSVVRAKANGQCKTWKTRPNDFHLPVKHGMYDYGYISNHNADDFHVESECPIEELR